MSIEIIATDSPTVTYEPIEEGTHLARCVKMVHIGTIEESFGNDEPKPKNKVFISWEFPTMLIEEGDYKGQTRLISKEYTLSLNSKSTLRKHLDAWRGKAFTAEEALAFDIAKLAGVPCMITVTHTEKGDKKYANISGISGIPKGINAPDQIHPTMLINATNVEDNKDHVPDYILEKLYTSKEYIELHGPTETEAPAPVAEDDEENLPF